MTEKCNRMEIHFSIALIITFKLENPGVGRIAQWHGLHMASAEKHVGRIVMRRPNARERITGR